MSRYDESGLNGLDKPPAETGLARTVIRNILILLAVCLMSAWALSHRGKVTETLEALAPAPQEPATAISEPAPASVEMDRELVIHKSPGGHFLLQAQVNGVEVLFMLDTGASDVVLSAEDARRIRLNLRNLKYTRKYRTANGITRAAPVTLRDIRIGQLRLDEVEAAVNEAPMQISLLGMSFLERLEGYAVRGDRLILQW